MQMHQKILTVVLLILIGMILGVLLMIARGAWISPDRFEVRYTDVTRSLDPAENRDHRNGSSLPDIVGQVVHGVVYIETDMVSTISQEDDSDGQGFWDRILPQRRGQSIGSGVLISNSGFIITNHHVIEGAEDRIRVVTYDNRLFEAQVMGSDPSTDLAVIKINWDDAQPLIIGDSDHIMVGDAVMAIGNPFRLRSTVTAGIVSAIGRDVDIINDRMRIESFIQTDAAINRGNSGGALVNRHGELIGINTAIASESGTYQGYGFAIPVNLAMKIAKDLIEFGEVKRAYLGVEIATLDFNRALQFGLDHISGVEIRNLVDGGSAEIGGLQEGDVILEVDGFKVNQANRLQERIAMLRPGEEVQLTIWRDKKEIKKNVLVMGFDNEAIREWASRTPQPLELLQLDEHEGILQKSYEEIGFRVAELANQQDLSFKELIIIRVWPSSRAYHAGLQVDDVVKRINGETVMDLNQFDVLWMHSIQNNDVTRVDVERGGDIHILFFND